MNKKGRYDDDDYDYDDDYEDDDYEDDEYYGEEGEGECYDEEGAQQAAAGAPSSSAAAAPAAPPATSPAPKFQTITEEADVDFVLLAELVPTLYKLWNERNPLQLSLGEAEAVEGLREANYDLDAAEQALKAKRIAERKARGQGTGAKTLKVTSAPAKDAPAPTAEGEGSSAAAAAAAAAAGDSSKAAAAPPKKTKAEEIREKKIAGAVPDAEKPDITVVIAGHVDAGKSTTLGHLLLLLGKVSAKEVLKNEKEGKGSNKDSFKYAWLLDQSEEERRRGVTIDSGSYSFETDHRRVQVLDAPGHKDFVLSMVSSTTQADAALLMVNAGTSEFETGLAHGTKDHLLILKTLGVSSIIVGVNKMDTVGYSQERFHFIEDSLRSLLQKSDIGMDRVLGFCPISGMAGVNLIAADREAMPWYDGPALLELIDTCPLQKRILDAPLRVNVLDVDGEVIHGKVESGKLMKGDKLQFVPCDAEIVVRSIRKSTTDSEVGVAFAGENVSIRTKSSTIQLYQGCIGFVKDSSSPVLHSTEFEAHIQALPTLANAIIPGTAFIMVVHGIHVPVRVKRLVSRMREDGTWTKGMVKCVPLEGQAIVVLEADSRVALEPAEKCRSLGNFVLQQDGEIVAGGLVLQVLLV